MDEIEEQPRKQQKLAYHHRHVRHHDLQTIPTAEPGLVSSEVINKLVVDSIRAICEEQAWKQDIVEPMIQSLALDALQDLMEEFVKKFCTKIHRSMLSARRTVPIATDVESAFLALDIPRPDEQILPFHNRPATNPALLPTPPPEDEFHTHVELPSEFLGPELSKQSNLKNFGSNVSSLPPLPSAHTYKDTPVFSQREKDSRRIRELATDEGKLGEQALRKLAGAVKIEAALAVEMTDRSMVQKGRYLGKQPALTEEVVFEETMRDLLREEAGEFELGPIVSSEKAFRMPDDVRVKRRLAGLNKSTATGPSTGAPVNKYNLMPPPR